MKRLLWVGSILVVIIVALVTRSVLLVPEGRSAKVADNAAWLEPGLHWLSPLAHHVHWQDRRQQVLLASGSHDQPYVSVTTFDQKHVNLGYLVLWQVTDRAVFATHYSGERQATKALRAAINQALSQCCLSETLAQWLNVGSLTTNAAQALAVTNTILAPNGLKLSQLVITAVSVPTDTRDAWLEAMRARDQGSLMQLELQTTTLAASLKASVDSKVSKTVADAQSQADALRADADTKATTIYAKAYQKDPAFYEFYMNLKAYQQVFKARSQVIVLDSHSGFFKSMS